MSDDNDEVDLPTRRREAMRLCAAFQEAWDEGDYPAYSALLAASSILANIAAMLPEGTEGTLLTPIFADILAGVPETREKHRAERQASASTDPFRWQTTVKGKA